MFSSMYLVQWLWVLAESAAKGITQASHSVNSISYGCCWRNEPLIYQGILMLFKQSYLSLSEYKSASWKVIIALKRLDVPVCVYWHANTTESPAETLTEFAAR